MSPQRLAKNAIFAETLPIRELLEETLRKLQMQPKTTVACRQLAVIVDHLSVWQKRYMPDLAAAIDKTSPENPYTREQLDTMLSAYRQNGYFGLTDEQKVMIDWFDRNYRTDDVRETMG